MIYFDHSATTIPSKIVLDKYTEYNILYPGNFNSPHKLGKIIKEEVKKNKEELLKLLLLSDKYDLLYTSGATESNNYVFLGFALKNNIKYIITDSFEHSSVVAPIGALQKEGVKVDFASFDNNGLIDLNNLEKMINDYEGNILISISPVNSEIGIKQDIDGIKEIVKRHQNVYFHTDATQAIGKINIDYEGIDFITFSCHKFYGLKGIGGLIYHKNLTFNSLIKGGESLSKFRSGTPCHPLILSVNDALRYVLVNNDYDYVMELKEYLINRLKEFKNIYINSNKNSIPHIVNVSFMGHNSLDIVNYLSDIGIYISNHTACSSNTNYSIGVYALTKDMKRSTSSVRISLSFLNTKEEIDILIDNLKEII